MLSPKVLLSAAAREKCIANIKDLPAFVFNNTKPKEKASVLIPLCVDDGEVCLLYTLRSSNLKNHSGQVSFPGGKREENESVVETALRETEEEIGISPNDVEIWGAMSEVQGRNKNMLITPVIGLIKNFNVKNLKINKHEVEEVFTVPMKSFCDSSSHGYFQYENLPMSVYLYKNYKIWGITGVLTHIFLQCFLSNDVYNFDFKGKKYELDELMPAKL